MHTQVKLLANLIKAECTAFFCKDILETCHYWPFLLLWQLFEAEFRKIRMAEGNMHANIFHWALEVMIVAHKTVSLNYLVIVIEEMRSEPPDCVHKLLFIFRQRCQNTGIRTTTVLTEIRLIFLFRFASVFR